MSSQPQIPVEEDLWRRYRPRSGVYDELCTADGGIRPHWQNLLPALNLACGKDQGSRCHSEVQRLLQENGLAYSVYDDPRHAQRPWVVDPIPLALPGAEWAAVEAGLAQRARLLERLLADIYGPQTVLRQGLLPPELIFSHPGFLRPAHQSLGTEQRWLTFMGVDLARYPDGGFRVVGDRTQTPAGAGYALENRIILARAMSRLYRDAPLRRLAGFLETLRSTLQQSAPHHREQPRVVLLSPGPSSRSYFEHAYLANYLSLSLVEGADLVVRDQGVRLKTLGGLQPVDVILRRVDDENCDPLELRGDSRFGMPGLLQAVRGGAVSVANPIGTGVLENPALLPFLPELCRHLLGEDLKLPSVATWWCGRSGEREEVLSRLPDLTMHCILPNQPVWHGPQLDGAGCEELDRRIRGAPYLYVAQEQVPYSNAPVLGEQGLEPRPMLLRGFAVWGGDGYRVMPGALARVARRAGGRPDRVREGGISKDLWVLAPVAEKHVSLLRQGSGPVVLTRDGSDLPSRVADSLFWMGRYGERLDGTARLLREALVRLLEQEREAGEESCLDDLFTALELPALASDLPPRERFFTARRQLLNLLMDPEPGHGLPAALSGLLSNSQAVRNHLGDDSWRVLNRLEDQLSAMHRVGTAGSARRHLEEVLTLLAAFFGLNNETMPHHLGWVFLDIGRYLERVQNSLALLKLAFVTAQNPGAPLWEVVMSSTDNLSAYRRRYRSELHPTAILDLLLFDEDNPRSVGFQVRRLQSCIDRLHHPKHGPYRSSEERLILQAVSTLQLADIQPLAALGSDNPKDAETRLARLLDELQQPLNALSEALIHSHFSHAEVPRQLLEMSP